MEAASTKEKLGVKINDYTIPWSFVWQTYAKCGRDWDCTMDAFWKARNCTGKNGIQRYILCGFKHPTKYILSVSKERENGKMDSIREWWLSLYDRKKDTSAECVDMADMIAAISGKFDFSEIIKPAAKPLKKILIVSSSTRTLV